MEANIIQDTKELYNTTFYFSRFAKLDEVKEASLHFRLHRRVFPSIDMDIDTQVIANVESWNKAEYTRKTTNKVSKSKEITDVYNRLQRPFYAAYNLFVANVTDKKLIRQAVYEAIHFKEIEERKAKEEELKAQKELKAQRKREEDNNVLSCCKRMIDGIKKSGISVDGLKYKRANSYHIYSDNAKKMWHTFGLILERYYKVHPFTWKDANDDLSLSFTSWMESNGYMKSTQNKYNICLKHLIGFYYDKGVHTTNVRKQMCGVNVEEDKDKAVEIALTHDEVEALYQMELNGMEADCRDIFLVGVYSCQRFSDYSRITSNMIGTTAKGNPVIRIKQKKTGKNVIIPLLNDRINTILNRHNGTLPKVIDVVFNRNIKNVLKKLSESVTTLKEEVSTVLTIREKKMKEEDKTFRIDKDGKVFKPRWACVSSHCARRTGITELYRSHKFTNQQMMSVSGHSSERIFLHYVKMSGEDIADDMFDTASSNDGLF